MTNIEIIEKLKKSKFIDDDNEEYQLEFQDALTEQEITDLKKEFPNGFIANEILQILRLTKGWDGYGPSMVYFDSIGEFGHTELSPYSITLGHDGFGNYWILDIDKEGNLGKVFFACHDPAVFIIHSQSLNEYLHHLVDFYENPGNNHLDEIHETDSFSVWDNNTECISKKEFLVKNPSYTTFMNRFEGDEWTIADLRKGSNKLGFAWGKYSLDRNLERHPNDLIWILRNKKKSFLSRILNK